MPLSIDQQARLLEHVRGTIEAGWTGRSPQPAEASVDRVGPVVGCFVTLRGPKGLRGCRGVLGGDDAPGAQLSRSARLAAFDDPRFPPVGPEEAGGLHLEVSLLRAPRVVRRLEEVEVGRHGLLLTLGDRQGFLLPQVAADRGWDRDRFLAALCVKAGLPEDAWRDPTARLEAFEVEYFAAPFRHAAAAPLKGPPG